MSILAAPVNHIRVDETSAAWIEGSSFRVSEIVLDHLVHGWSPEEICFQHYDQLTLAQVYAALAYYYDHQIAIDAEIESRRAEAQRLQDANVPSPLRERLRARTGSKP